MKIAEFLLGSIPVLLQFYADMYRETDLEKTMLELENENNVPKIKSYDFVIVGGGSAGCVLAGRLSEFFDVLLLEAGGNPPPATAVPLFRRPVQTDPTINYFFQSVPQANASRCCDGITATHTGRMVGGSGSHNDMVHSRGSPKDYDNWANILNDESFNYANVLKYFKKMETFVGQKFGTDDDAFYGTDGPIKVDSMINPVLDLWFEAGLELGYPIGDPNGFQRESFTTNNVAINRGQRSSSYAEYIKPIEASRSSLTVIRYANVSEILLDDDKKAYGVAYLRHGFPQIAYAQKEIILSAGAYSSPLLLMKSGIGPESILNAAEIPIKVPMEAVGKNLGEHPSFIMTGVTVNDSSIFLQMDPQETEKISADFHNGEGLLTVVTEGPQCFIVSPVGEPDWPDLWIEIEGYMSNIGEEPQISFYNVVGRPKSKGQLTLDTDKYKAGIRDDVQLALIDFKLLDHPDDMEAMLYGVKFILQIMETDAFKSVNMRYTDGPDPACSEYTFLTDDYWRCKIQQDALAWIHMVGTCSMGTDSATSVVDTQFRVRGVSNLRIVDGSVIPVVTNANLNAPVMMLAEKASDDIINFYRVSEPETSSATNSDTTINRQETTTNSQETTPSQSTSILVETNKLFLVSIFALIVRMYI